ncbi:hypothetical protein U0030_12440 [Brevundimonas bullata]|uniref:hypothetical protein n=1 Tax=Brevundimonas bullata TaxID=13160 RepID=UPI0013B43F39|nr:hypothetical protein [Brevundimonas bullata]WQE36072.1 hypothetical protein U0030_12440 [Brevundimonas bullata]
MKSRIDPDTIAKAMKAAAVVAKTGTREERSGKFIAPKPPPCSAVEQSTQRSVNHL